MDLNTLSDNQLFALCQKYGENTREWRQKFLGLLPEVNRRNLFRKKGFTSIYHFAAMLAGVNQNQVDVILRLEKKLVKTPKIKNLFVEGKVSHYKLDRIASVVNSGNEQFWLQQVKTLPKSALNTLVRDVKGNPHPKIKNTELHLSAEVTNRLLELQNKGINVNDVLVELLEIRDEVIQKRKLRLAEKYKDTVSSRYVPKEILHILNEEYGSKCAVPTCDQPRYNNHHTLYFSLARNHNPLFIVPLCKDHHAIAHAINIQTSSIRMDGQHRAVLDEPEENL